MTHTKAHILGVHISTLERAQRDIHATLFFRDLLILIRQRGQPPQSLYQTTMREPPRNSRLVRVKFVHDPAEAGKGDQERADHDQALPGGGPGVFFGAEAAKDVVVFMELWTRVFLVEWGIE